jgi:cathepsin L
MAPQELVDCANGLFSSHGCSGGWYYYAYDWLKKHQTMRESDYAYTSGTTMTESKCSYDKDLGVTNVSGYVQVKKNTDSIKAAIEITPVNVAVAAGNDVFRNYKSGIVTEEDGCPTRVDHAILAVGYGYEGTQGYYIVRNSWNTTWGDDGYIKIGMADGKKGVCGINQDVYYPII